jgi:hypothetical protein
MEYEYVSGGLAAAGGARGGMANGESVWALVGKDRTYTPTKLDVGHRMQLRVSVRPHRQKCMYGACISGAARPQVA